MKKRGFTLIELLVVVLIIGILSAIALPQYTLAVEKARMAEALQNAASLRRAIDIYLMANGWPNGYTDFVGNSGAFDGNANLLDIDVESVLTCDQDDGDWCRSKYFVYDAFCENSCHITIERHQNGDVDSDYEYILSWEKSPTTNAWNTGGCNFNGNYPYSEKLCAQLRTQGWN